MQACRSDVNKSLGEDMPVPKKGNNIYKRKDGRWEGRFIKGYGEKGAVYGYVYAPSYGEAKRKLAAAATALASATASAAAVRLSFSAAAARWLVGLGLRVKPSTEARYAWLLRRHILPRLGGLKLDKLTTGQIENFTKEKLTNGRLDGRGGLAAKTVRDMLSVVKSVLSFAAREGCAVSAVTVVYPRNQAKTMRVLSRQEQTALEKALRRQFDVYKLGILLCLYTGLRIGEACALRQGDVSLSEGVISVRRTAQRLKNHAGGKPRTVLTTGRPKSKCSERDIPLPPFLAELIAAHADPGWEYLLNKKGRCLDPRTLQNHFQRLLQEAGIKHANFHALRHTFSTRCIEEGMDAKSLSEILGHADVKITLNRYVHSSPEQKRAGMNKLARLFGQAA
jgi:integrase